MGISGLLQALKQRVDKVHISALGGRTAAIDTLCWCVARGSVLIFTPPHRVGYPGCTKECTPAPLNYAPVFQHMHTSATAWTALACCCATTSVPSWCLTAATFPQKLAPRRNARGRLLDHTRCDGTHLFA